MIGLTNSKNYKDIADSIRSKGVSGDFKPSEMAAAIRSIGGGDDVLLKYTDDMGYNSNGTVCENTIANLLAVATAASKDLKITFKIGSATFDDWVITFYFGDKLRIGPKTANGKLYIQVGGGTSEIFDCDASKEYTLIIHTATKKFEVIQEGTVIDIRDYWAPSETRPFDTVSGTTSVYAKQNWLKYLTVALI